MSKIMLENPQPINLRDIVNHITLLQYELGGALGIITDEIYNLEDPADFEKQFKNDFDTINAELKTDPRALIDPEKLKDIPARTKKLFMLITTVQKLSPPPPGFIQIVN